MASKINSNSLILACRTLYSAIAAFDDQVAQRAGISLTELRCLTLLETGPITPSVVANALGLTSGAVTGLLDRLEKKGLIQRQPNPSDRRSLQIVGTPKLFAGIGAEYKFIAEQLGALAESYSEQELENAVRHITDAARKYSAQH